MAIRTACGGDRVGSVVEASSPPARIDPAPAELDDDACDRAMRARDRRFDGWFYVGVRTTGVYCRPSCPTPVQPKRTNIDFYPSAAAAQQAGFRACKRCRPDATPGSPHWNLRDDLVGRALRLVADGEVDRSGVHGLASRLGVSDRHLGRVLVEEVGAGPIALARAQRAHAARLLIETTDFPFIDVAFAAGFSSVRQFNDTVRTVYRSTPSELRRSAAKRPGSRSAAAAGAAAGPISIRLAVRTPFDHEHLLRFLAVRAVSGVELCDRETYRRSARLAHGVAVVELTPAGDHVAAAFHLADLRDLTAATARVRRLLDLDADPVAVDESLAADPTLARVVALRPGRRVPGAFDAHELAIRAVLGQQVSVAAARTVAERLARRLGEPLVCPVGSVDRLFPDVDVLAGADPTDLGLPAARGRAVVALAGALASGVIVLDAGSDRRATVEALTAIPGIGPWTASYIAMRGLSDPDVFLPTDVAVRSGADRLGLPSDPVALSDHARMWAPWRSYAVQHLWSAAIGDRDEGRPGRTTTERRPR